MNRRTILRNIFNLSISEIVSRLINFISFIYLARVIFAEGFGIISFIVAFSSYFLLIVNFSSDIIASRETARLIDNSDKPDGNQTRQARLAQLKHAHLQTDRSIFVSKILSLRIILACLSYMLLVCMVAFMHQPAEIKTGLLIYGLTFFAQAINLSWYFKGREKTAAVAFAQISSSLINLLLVVIIIKNRTNQTDAIAIFTGAAFINSILMLVNYKRKEKPDAGFMPPLAGFIIDNLKKSFPVALAGIMITIYYNLDHVMLGYMTNVTELGYYAAAYKIIIIALVPAGIIYQAFLPQLSNSVKNNILRRNLMEVYSKTMMIIGAFFTAIIFLFANEIVEVAFGVAYSKSVLLTQILAFNIFLVYWNMIYGNALIASNNQKLYLYPIATAALLNVLLNVLLIPQYKAVGAAIATISSEIVVLCGFVSFYYRITKSTHFKNIAKGILGFVFPSVMFFVLEDYLTFTWKLIIVVCFVSVLFYDFKLMSFLRGEKAYS